MAPGREVCERERCRGHVTHVAEGWDGRFGGRRWELYLCSEHAAEYRGPDSRGPVVHITVSEVAWP